MNKSRTIGLFFGSFNPVHIGHMIIGNFIVENADLDEVWYIVSPQNPFKKKESLAADRERLHMVRLAIGDNVRLKASDVEFSLPTPSYTVDTLTVLAEKYPHYNFVLIMGGDNLPTLPKWKNYELLLSNYKIIVYSRPDYELGELAHHHNIQVMEAPLMSLSSTLIRQQIKENKSIEYMVPEAVFQYIDGSSLYKP